MGELHYTKGATPLAVAIFLILKAKTLGSALSLDGFQSHITMCAAKESALPPWDKRETMMVRAVKRACRVTFQSVVRQAPPWGKPQLDTIYDKVRPSPHTNLYEYAIFTQMVVHHSALARPGDICGDMVVATAGDITFLPKTATLPQGGVHIDLEKDKGSRQMGSTRPSLLQACGTGGPTCPVVLLKQFSTIYALEANPEEPIFASMLPSGLRIGPPGATQGARVISNQEYNAGIKILCKKAGLPRYTARGARPARKMELSCAGAADPVVTTLGRWHTYQASRPYDSQSIALLEHVARVLGIKPDALPPLPQPQQQAPHTAAVQEPAAPPAAKRTKRQRKG